MATNPLNDANEDGRRDHNPQNTGSGQMADADSYKGIQPADAAAIAAADGLTRGKREEADAVIAEDDDNPYHDSDEALPDAREEANLRHEMGGEGVHFEQE